jgi:NADH pyrophosphatase NudC (nudix superfamily)
VHFFLLRYLSGDTNEHDHEVNEARWVQIDQAVEMLAFENEKRVVSQAKGMIAAAIQGRSTKPKATHLQVRCT